MTRRKRRHRTLEALDIADRVARATGWDGATSVEGGTDSASFELDFYTPGSAVDSFRVSVDRIAYASETDVIAEAALAGAAATAKALSQQRPEGADR